MTSARPQRRAHRSGGAEGCRCAHACSSCSRCSRRPACWPPTSRPTRRCARRSSSASTARSTRARTASRARSTSSIGSARALGAPLRRINFLAQFGVLTPGMYVEIRPGNGAPGVRGTLTRPGETRAGAAHPERLRPGRRRRAAGRATVGAISGGARFRLLAQSVPFADSTLILGVPLHETDTTLNQLKWIEALVACAVIASVLLLRALADHRKPAAAAAHRGDGRRDRRGRPLAPRRARRRDDRDRSPRRRPQRHARADRGRVRRAFGLGGATAPLHLGRLARAAHARRGGQRLRGALRPRRPRSPGRPGALDDRASSARRAAWACSSATCCCSRDSTRGDRSRPGRVDLAALAGEAVDAAHAMEPARPLALEAPAAVTVTGDAERLRQVVDNLLANVRAHTRPPRPPRSCACMRDGTDAVLEVEDAAPGMDAERGRARLRALLSAATPHARATTAARASGSRSWPRSSRRTAAASAVESMPGAGNDVPRDAARPRRSRHATAC